MLASFDKDAVRAANPIERLIPELLNEHPIEMGGELKVRCPWHDDRRPSLRVNAAKGVWRCDVCNTGGDVFDFVQGLEHLSFPDALKFLAQRADVPLALSAANRSGRTNGNDRVRHPVGDSASSSPQPARWPQPQALRWFDYPVSSDLLARKVRYDEALAGRKASWLHSRDGGNTWHIGQGCADPGLYGIAEAVAMPGRTDVILIAEGERDARRLLDLKWLAVSPPHGASLAMGDKWRPAYTEQLKAAGFTRAYVIGDHDAAGEGEPGRGNGFNGDIARALNAAGIDARPLPWDASEPAGYDITDFCDHHAGEATARLRERIEAVKAGPRWVDPAPPESPPKGPRVSGADDPGRVRPVLTCLADVSPEDVTWIWRGRVAAGKLNLIAGDPGLGKSFVTLDLIARYTTGRPLPDGSPGIPSGTAILLSAEDGLGDTIRPRLDALGADVQRVHYVATVIDGRQERSIQLADVEALEEAILTKDAGLVVIDPLSAYVGDTDSHRDAAVRGLLAPLAQLADRYRVTILGVIHLSKNSQRSAIHRAIGSIAFVGAARVVLAVAADPENEQRRLLAPVKNNLSSPAPVLAFSIPDGRLVYEPQPVAGMDINDVLRGPTFDRPERRDADEWLSHQLAEGPVPVKELMREAKAAGMSWSTVERAKARGKVVARRVGFSGPWSWHSPKTVTDAPADDALWQIPKDSTIEHQSDSLTLYGSSSGEAGPVNGEQLSLPLATDGASGPRGPARTRDHLAPRAPQAPWIPLDQRQPAFDFDPDPIGRLRDP